VVIGHGLPLLGRQRRERLPQVVVALVDALLGAPVATGLVDEHGDVGRRDRGAGARPGDVDRLAVRDRHEPRLDVGPLVEAGVGREGRQERLGPGVLGVHGAQDRAAHPQDRGAVLGDDAFEGLHVR
jgi:hypothetical protein